MKNGIVVKPAEVLSERTQVLWCSLLCFLVYFGTFFKKMGKLPAEHWSIYIYSHQLFIFLICNDA